MRITEIEIQSKSHPTTFLLRVRGGDGCVLVQQGEGTEVIRLTRCMMRELSISMDELRIPKEDPSLMELK